MMAKLIFFVLLCFHRNNHVLAIVFIQWPLQRRMAFRGHSKGGRTGFTNGPEGFYIYLSGDKGHCRRSTWSIPSLRAQGLILDQHLCEKQHVAEWPH